MLILDSSDWFCCLFHVSCGQRKPGCCDTSVTALGCDGRPVRRFEAAGTAGFGPKSIEPYMADSQQKEITRKKQENELPLVLKRLCNVYYGWTRSASQATADACSYKSC